MKETLILVLVALVLVLMLIQLVTSSNQSVRNDVSDLAQGQQKVAGNVAQLQQENKKLRQSVKSLETSIENLDYSMWRAGSQTEPAETEEGDTETDDLVSLQEELLTMNQTLERLSKDVSGIRNNRSNNFQRMQDLVRDPQKFSAQLDKFAADYAKNIDDANQQYAFQQDIDRLKEMAGKIDDPDLYDYVNNILQERLATTTSTRMQNRLTRAQESLTTLEGEELQSQLERISTFTTMYEVREVSEKYNIPPETMQEYGLPVRMGGRNRR